MSFFNSLDVSASGLTAQKVRMDVISENIANVSTTRTADGTPYKRKITLFQERKSDKSFSEYLSGSIDKVKRGNGVRVSRIVTDNTPGAKVYEPNHPDADEEGYITNPNVNMVEEMVNLIAASRSYEANATAINTTKGMLAKTLEIGAR